jgi:steroid delta-isomerase-like uncharacterized protein
MFDPVQAMQDGLADLNNRELRNDPDNRWFTLHASDVVLEGWGAENTVGRDAVIRDYGAWYEAFDDLVVSYEQFVVEGPYVAARAAWVGTQTGEFEGVPPSGRTINLSTVGVLQFEDQMITRRWSSVDRLGLLEQIGAWPVSR